MNEQLKSNILSGKHWLRFVYMVFFAICLQVSRFVMWVVVCVQFLFSLITGSDNPNLRAFGMSLTEFIFQALKFLTYNTEEKPFPFAEWPSVEVEKPLEGEVELRQESEESDPVEVDVPEASAEEHQDDKVESETAETSSETKKPEEETEAEKS